MLRLSRALAALLFCLLCVSPAAAQRLPDCDGFANFDAAQTCRAENERAIWLVEALSSAIAEQSRAAEARRIARQADAEAESGGIAAYFTRAKEWVMGLF